MKTLIIFFTLIFLSMSLTAQKPDFTFNDEGIIHYQEVVEVPGKTSEQLYNDARKWFVKAFKNPKEVIQFDDKSTFSVSGNGLFYLSEGTNTSNFIKFKILIEAKENKYRYTVSHFKYGHPSYPNEADLEQMNDAKGLKFAIKNQHRLLTQIDTDINNFISNMKSSMSKTANQEDW